MAWAISGVTSTPWTSLTCCPARPRTASVLSASMTPSQSKPASRQCSFFIAYLLSVSACPPATTVARYAPGGRGGASPLARWDCDCLRHTVPPVCVPSVCGSNELVGEGAGLIGSGRQSDAHRCAEIFFAVHGDRAAVGVDDRLGDH